VHKKYIGNTNPGAGQEENCGGVNPSITVLSINIRVTYELLNVNSNVW